MPTTVPASPLAVPARRWVYPEQPDAALVERLCSDLGLPHSFCRLLVQRGYGEPETAKRFLRPRSAQIHPAGLLAGMDDAVERLRLAIGRGETILVHGDYDVDGICATALYVRALRAMGARPVPFVPHRLMDGYDLTDVGIRAATEAGASLILTGDCGIVAHQAIARARLAGIDVVVTDHHTPGATLPDAW
jgi:single-stranded-DNA-specific exonuclease